MFNDVYKQTKVVIIQIIPFQNFTSVDHGMPFKLLHKNSFKNANFTEMKGQGSTRITFSEFVCLKPMF